MTPIEIQNKQFDKAMSGYRADEVSAFLLEVSDFVESILKENAELKTDKEEIMQKMMVLAEKIEEYRDDEEAFRSALVGAEKLGKEIVRKSKEKAEEILSEAQKTSDAMVADIKKNVERETEALNKMRSEVSLFKGQMLSIYRSHIESINAIPNMERIDLAPPRMPTRQEPVAEVVTAAIAIEKEPEPIAEPMVEKELTPSQLLFSEEIDDADAKTDTFAERQAEPAADAVKIATSETKKPSGVSITDRPLTERVDRLKNFTVNIDDTADSAEEPQKKESRHGDLLFGERYALKRND